MMDSFRSVQKTVDDAITEALLKLETTSDKIEYEVIDKGEYWVIWNYRSKPAIIKVRKKFNLVDHTYDFLDKLFKAMNLEVKSTVIMMKKTSRWTLSLMGMRWVY